MTLTEVMNELRVNDLKAAAKLLGLPKAITRKVDLIPAVEQYVETNLELLLGRMGERERLLLAEAAHHEGRISPRVFVAKHDCDLPGDEDDVDGKTPRSRHSTLIQLITFRDDATGETCIPEGLAQRLKAALPKPADATVVTVDEIPAVWHPTGKGSDTDEDRPIRTFEGEKTVFAELRRVLNLVQTGKVRVQDKNGRPADGAVRLLTTALVTPEFDVEVPGEDREEYIEAAGPVRAHAWAVLVQQCGWAKPQGGVLALTKAGKDLLGRVSPEGFRDGFQRFLGDDRFDELNRINHIRGQTGKAKRYMTHPSERREAVCDSMVGWPVGRWIAFGEAFRFVDASGGYLDVTDSPYDLYMADSQYGRLGDAGDDVERQYARALFMESLATLGVVDIAYVYPHWMWPELGDSWGIEDMAFCGRYDGLLYVRLSSLGAYCLGRADRYEPPAPEQRGLLKVLANRELAVRGGELTPADRATLELFAEQSGDHLWRLDSQRILDHVERGGSVEDVTRFLAQNTTEEIPHTVEVFLGDLAAKLDAVQGVQRAMLLEMKDAEVAARVAHDRRTQSLCRLAGERHLVVPESSERAFRTAMKKLGCVVPP